MIHGNDKSALFQTQLIFSLLLALIASVSIFRYFLPEASIFPVVRYSGFALQLMQCVYCIDKLLEMHIGYHEVTVRSVKFITALAEWNSSRKGE